MLFAKFRESGARATLEAALFRSWVAAAVVEVGLKRERLTEAFGWWVCRGGVDM